MAMALAAAALNDPDNAQLKADARKEAEEILLKNPSAKEVTYYDDDELNAIRYNERMTYNMPQTGDPTQPIDVYKRQICPFSLFYFHFSSISFQTSCEPQIQTIKTVSYTHLDVYKRQI